MTDPRSVAPGEMRLYDHVRPALPDDVYRLTAATQLNHAEFPVQPVEAFFELTGPRFALPAPEVVSVHPPRNAQGGFAESFPHVVLGRRTLPWEREADPDRVIGPTPTDPLNPEPPPLDDPATPWLALLVFVDDPDRSEVRVLPAPVPLSTVVTDPVIRARFGLGDDPPVDAVEADAGLLRQILPTRDELQLLCHARQVNVDDRELAAGDNDGWFAVVMAARLPTPGLRHRACLVSVEQRSDLVAAAAPGPAEPLPSGPRRLVLLHTWSFTAAPARPGGGSFKEITQDLDAGLYGSGVAQVTDTGHLPLALQDRVGAAQAVWYRGPLCARPVDRDPLGPYHSADQARRISPETGAEDISYAAAFEVGRLLTAADGRLAQELMQWRREAYRRAARTSVAGTVWRAVPAIVSTPADAVTHGMTAPVAVTVFERAGTGAGEPADVNGVRAVRAAPGLDPGRLARAWNVSAQQARSLLAGAEPTEPATPLVAAAPATVAGEDLQAVRRRLLGIAPAGEPDGEPGEGGTA
jgi:hypothetical protein